VRFDAAYFEGLYAADADPWKFETSAYENAKYDATVAALGGRRFGCVLEVGCSIGVLTQKLAPHADAILALDIAPAAIETARARNRDLTHATFVAGGVLDADLEGPFDLILFSEVLYYLTAGELVQAAHRTRTLLAPGGEVLLVNWLGKGHHPLSGDEAANGFVKALGSDLTRTRRIRRRRYRLDHLRRG
jgi:SAM-dependent methyltransferase